MGNSSSPTASSLAHVTTETEAVKSRSHSHFNIPPAQQDWDVIFRGNVEEWTKVAADLGLDDYQVGCRLGAEMCDRDYVCTGYLCVMYRRWKRVLHITRFKRKPLEIPVGGHLDMCRLLSAATARRLLVVALARDLAVLEMMVGDRKHAFPIVDLSNKCVRSVYRPTFLLTLIEGEITPDQTQTGLLLYSQAPESHAFTYSLYLISNKTGEVMKRVCLSLGDSQPHFSFHPNFWSPHIAVSQYRVSEGSCTKLVILKVNDETVKVSSTPHLSFIIGKRQMFTKFSPDGRFLLLQKLADDRFGVTSFCDTYIFNVTENTFHLVKYISSKIPGVFFSCRVSFKPEFSRCGRYMRILNTSSTVEVTVLALPNCLDLMSRCRQIIMGSLSSFSQVSELPIPNRLKDFLLFKPTCDV